MYIKAALMLSALFCLLLNGIRLGEQEQEYDFLFKEELSLPLSFHLSIQNEVGTINVQSHPAEKLIVEAKKIVRVKKGISEEEAMEYAKAIKIDILQQNKETEVLTKFLKVKDRKLKGRAVDYKILVPKQVGKLNIRGGVGDVQVTSIKGSVDIELGVGGVICEYIQKGDIKVKVGVGDVKIADVEGLIHVETGTGGILCKDIQTERFRVRTGVGDIKLMDVKGLLDVETGVGKVSCENIQRERLKIKTGVGGVEIW